MSEKEEWRDIAGYEGLYQVSNSGNVKVVKSFHSTKNGKLFQLKPGANGYVRISLWKNGIRKMLCVHHIVCEAFIGSRPKGKVVNHIDFNRANNRIDNLEYLTTKENIHHSLPRMKEALKKWHDAYNPTRPRGDEHWSHKKPQFIVKGEKQGSAKLTDKKVSNIKKQLKQGARNIDLARQYNVNVTTIERIKYGKGWKHIS